MNAHGDHDMGHTVAGWTGSALGILAFTTAGAGLVLASPAVLWAGAALAPAAALATWLLHLAGWGKPSGPRPPHLRHWRTRDRAARLGHPDCTGCRLAGRGRRRTAAESSAAGPSGVEPPAVEPLAAVRPHCA
ncbi:HGxxPAAW family protein [Kitasatospora phosalacinea]|uniref:HGxxPAAW family protein n=1 Tax=Kitasatospora phosalacinea TaxID=2065 RepID=UPI0035D7059D